MSPEMLAMARGVHGRPCEIFLSSSLIVMLKLVAVCHLFGCRKGPKNVGDAGDHLLGSGGVADSLKISHKCRFGRSL